MRTFLTGILLLSGLLGFSQRQCATSTYTDFQQTLDPSFSDRVSHIEQFIARRKAAKTLGTDAPMVIRIPVVVHVVYQNAAQNISDQQIKSQIDALNRDFRRQNTDTANTPERFRPFAADVQIEFALATADPLGRATTGIVRKSTTVTWFSMDDKIKSTAQGGDDGWDSHSYLNIWVGDLGTLLGYSTVPGADAIKDGVVINYSAFGTINTGAPYNLGRTATHEVGHWLGLKHIWGDSYCGDDLVDDTPKQGNFTAGCPDGFRSSCDNGSLGDMYMNYMDFTNDACMNLFTQGQKQRMHALFDGGGPRNSILSSKGLHQPWVAESPLPGPETPAVTAFRFYPNPSKVSVTFNFQYDPQWMGKTISIVSVSGAIVRKFVVNALTQTLDISALSTGMYFIEGQNGSERIRQKLVKL